MAAVVTITLERDLPDATGVYAKAKPGKALARELEKLDYAARCKNVPGITSMLSENPAALAEQMRAEGFDPSRMRLPPEQWFAADDGLVTVRALIDYVSTKLNDFKQPNPILRDLKSCETLLSAAASADVRFHFTKAQA
jgi:hypothetical protein